MERARSRTILQAMEGRSLPLPIEVGGNSYLKGTALSCPGTYDVCLAFDHPEGPVVYGQDFPLNWECCALDPAGEYDRIKQQVLRCDDSPAVVAAGQVPWAECDDDGEWLAPGDREAAMRAWLGSKRDLGLDGEEIARWCAGVSEYDPGLEILAALRQFLERRHSLPRWRWIIEQAPSRPWAGMIWVQSTAHQAGFMLRVVEVCQDYPAVHFSGSIPLFNEFLGLTGLPFVLREAPVRPSGAKGTDLRRTRTYLTSRIRFLIVDDEVVIGRCLGWLLQVAFPAAEVRRARGNVEAREVLARFTPDLVLTDYSHMDGTGTDLLYWLRVDPRTRAVPVVLQTATTTRLGHEHERAGYDAIFEKPYKIAEVVETVGQLLGRKRRATKGGRGGVGP